jgi:hypothetical protein
LSIFQLGLRWLKRCIATAVQRLPVFQARLTPIRLASAVQESYRPSENTLEKLDWRK